MIIELPNINIWKYIEPVKEFFYWVYTIFRRQTWECMSDDCNNQVSIYKGQYCRKCIKEREIEEREIEERKDKKRV